MFTAVYLCCSPASQCWRLQLQLNKTSNRDTRLYCISFSPCPLKMTFTQPWEKGTKTRCSLWLYSSQLPTFDSFSNFLIFAPLYISIPTLWRIHSSDIHLHILARKPPSEYFSLLLCLYLFLRENWGFLCHGGLLQSVSSRLWFLVWARTTFGRKTSSYLPFFSTLTMKQW